MIFMNFIFQSCRQCLEGSRGPELDKVGNISFIEEQNSYTNKYRSQTVNHFLVSRYLFEISKSEKWLDMR